MPVVLVDSRGPGREWARGRANISIFGWSAGTFLVCTVLCAGGGWLLQTADAVLGCLPLLQFPGAETARGRR